MAPWFRTAVLVSNEAPVSSNEMALVRFTPNRRSGLFERDPSANSIVSWYW